MPISASPPTIHESTHYYDVEGRTEAQIVHALNANGPQDPAGARYWGRTEWTASWNFKTRPAGAGHCAVYDSDVRLEVITTLPRWTGAEDAPASVASKWRSMSHALVAHEGKHAAHGRAAIAKAADVLAARAYEGSCDTVRKRIEDAARALVRNGFALDAALDARTRHGASEGVFIRW